MGKLRDLLDEPEIIADFLIIAFWVIVGGTAVVWCLRYLWSVL
jgi:hypothetical protein